LAFGSADGSFFSFFGFRPRVRPDVCSNVTVVQTYVNEILPVISTIQGNSTLNAVLLLKWSNFVSYLQNTTNQALITNNCATFIANLKLAHAADDAVESKQEQIASNIDRQFQQVAFNATGYYEHNEFDW
jgi:hypothetical protein